MDLASQQILRARLINDEGLRLFAYYDQLGFPTQGAGHKLSNERYGALSAYPPISEDTAMAWLDTDILAASAGARDAFPWFDALDGIRAGVIIEMVFQMGVEGVAKFKNMLVDMTRGQYATAAEEMLSSQWHQETPARCEMLAEIMRTGQATPTTEEA